MVVSNVFKAIQMVFLVMYFKSSSNDARRKSDAMMPAAHKNMRIVSELQRLCWVCIPRSGPSLESESRTFFFASPNRFGKPLLEGRPMADDYNCQMPLTVCEVDARMKSGSRIWYHSIPERSRHSQSTV
eukprot:scaffold1165_cov87-Cyclotella_meneghiniana.AAC.2